MKKLYLMILILGLSLNSCFLWDGDDENFKEAYKEILLIRIKYQDTEEGNKHVEKVYAKYGFTEASFGDRYKDYMFNDREGFAALRDSLIQDAKRELLEIQKQEEEKRRADSLEMAADNDRNNTIEKDSIKNDSSKADSSSQIK